MHAIVAAAKLVGDRPVTGPEQTLVDAGYKVGDRLTVNVARHVVFVGAIVMVLEFARPWLGLGETPPALFLLWICFVFGAVAAWHARRPRVVYEKDGLWIRDGLYPWASVRSVALTQWMITVVAARSGGADTFSVVAVRSRSPSSRAR